MEQNVEQSFQQKMDADYGEYRMEAKKVTLIKTGKNAYDGMVTVMINGDAYEVAISVKADNSSLLWETKSGALNFLNDILAISVDPFVDSRDGQRYRVVKIIGNKTWMAQNLNFKIVDSWCYGNNESNCEKYGRLYDWNTAMKVCPEGWRLPTRKDWNNLVNIAGGNVAGTKLKSKEPYWNGTDKFGFSALPGGARWRNGNFSHVGNNGLWWGDPEDRNGIAYRRGMGSDYDDMGEAWGSNSDGFSVRCVQD